MKLGTRLKQIRRDLQLSQEAMGTLGVMSTPGWIKLENSQRSPSEKLIDKLVAFLVNEKHTKAKDAKALKEELLTLKYLGDPSAFVRAMATVHAKTLSNGETLLAPEPKAAKKKGRPVTK